MMLMLVGSNTTNGAELGGATGAIAPLVFLVSKPRKLIVSIVS